MIGWIIIKSNTIPVDSLYLPSFEHLFIFILFHRIEGRCDGQVWRSSENVDNFAGVLHGVRCEDHLVHEYREWEIWFSSRSLTVIEYMYFFSVIIVTSNAKLTVACW